jgi:hypothetical protein
MLRNGHFRGKQRWICGVVARARQVARYDADPVYRITKNMHDHARRRVQTLQRMKEGIVG